MEEKLKASSALTQPVVLLGFPGASLQFDTAHAIFSASKTIKTKVGGSGGSNGNFNNLWKNALNLGQAGAITHFAMIHSDICPLMGEPGNQDPRWLDILMAEMDRMEADLISVAVAIKDPRGLTSSGIGDPRQPWTPLKRFTVRELEDLPETFDATDAGFTDAYLLHNNGLWIADMRKRLWYSTDADGCPPVFFEYREKLGKIDGEWRHFQESEDWNFSRKLHAAGARTFVSSKVKCNHVGAMNFPNFGKWGHYDKVDKDTVDNLNTFLQERETAKAEAL